MVLERERRTRPNEELARAVRNMPSPAQSPEAQAAAQRMLELLHKLREEGVTQEEIDYLLIEDAPVPLPRG